MGHIGNLAAPPVQAAIADVAARCRRIGIPCGIVGPTPEMVVSFAAAGYDFVAVASDMGMMMRQATTFIEAIRTGPAAGFSSSVY
jgi:2-dehydro-3-deoxyglucarate aldolase/4-hydroxy-2-oxoheptanedioate aldolase